MGAIVSGVEVAVEGRAAGILMETPVGQAIGGCFVGGEATAAYGLGVHGAKLQKVRRFYDVAGYYDLEPDYYATSFGINFGGLSGGVSHLIVGILPFTWNALVHMNEDLCRPKW